MGSLTDLLGLTPRVAIVEAFAEHPELEFSAPEIVRQTGISKRGVYLHVAKLLEEGLIRKGAKVGKCQYYRVNENDTRGELLEVLESVFTLGKIEREVKRDRGIAPELPLAPRVEIAEVGADLSFETVAGLPVNLRRAGWAEALTDMPWVVSAAVGAVTDTLFSERADVVKSKLRSVVHMGTTASTVAEVGSLGVAAAWTSEAETGSGKLLVRAS